MLGESKALDAASAGKRSCRVRGLPALARRKTGVKPLLPREVNDKLVPSAWRKPVYANSGLPQGAVDRDAYVVCVLEQLHRVLNSRHVFASPSQMVVPGTPRDSLHILDALLNLDGGVKPEMVATGNASYSDMVFGPCPVSAAGLKEPARRRAVRQP